MDLWKQPSLHLLVFKGDNNICHFSQNASLVCLGFLASPGWGWGGMVSPVGFSDHYSSYFTGKELTWGFYQLPCVSISVLRLGTRKMIIGVGEVHRPSASTKSWTYTRIPDLQVSMSAWILHPKDLRMTEHFPFCSVQSSWVHFHRFLWEGTKEVIIIYPFYTVAGSFLVGICLPTSGKRFWV